MLVRLFVSNSLVSTSGLSGSGPLRHKYLLVVGRCLWVYEVPQKDAVANPFLGVAG